MAPRYLKAALRDFQPYTPGQQPPDGEGWVKLNTNESPAPPSPRVLDALRGAIDGSLRLYPSPTARPAREAIAGVLGLAPEQVALGNGGDELLALAVRAFAGSGDAVALAPPTYPLLEPLCRIHEVRPALHPLGDSWALPESFFEDPSPLKFLVNPNSPIGNWVPRETVVRLLESAPGVIVLDEAYADFAPESRQDLIAEHGNLLILRTFSKSYALAGMRLGYALGNPELIEALDTVKDSYPVDRLAVVAAVAAIQDRAHHRTLVESVVSERDWLTGQLAAVGFTVEPSAANFVFCRPPERLAAGDVHAGLRARRILVRHYDAAPIAGWLRITVGTRDQHQALLEAIGEL